MRTFRLGLIGSLCVGSLGISALSPAEPFLIDRQDQYSEWEFSTEAGFEGGQAERFYLVYHP